MLFSIILTAYVSPIELPLYNPKNPLGVEQDRLNPICPLLRNAIQYGPDKGTTKI